MKEKKWNDTTDGTGDKFWKNKPNWWQSQAKKKDDDKVKVRPTDVPIGWCLPTRARGGGDIGTLSGGGSFG